MLSTRTESLSSSSRQAQSKQIAFTSHSELKTQLHDALLIAQPNIGKAYLYQRCVNKYVDAMLPAIRAAISIKPSASLLPNQFHFSQSKVREAIGTIGKAQRYIEQVMKEHSCTSLLLIERKGYSKNGMSQPSIVRLNPLYEDLIVDALLNLHIEKNQKLLDDIEHTANYCVPIDKTSLRSYINKTTATLRSQRKGGKYEQALLRNLAAAQQILSMTHDADETHRTPFVKERWEQADSGRIYGQGYSLQRLPKAVRHAALGVCHKYDFKASAFALMAGLAQQIDSTLQVGGVLDYVKDRTKIRQRIAKELQIDESLVKTIFTAIGFGAELKNNSYSAIRGALARAARQKCNLGTRLDKDAYKRLGEDEYQLLIANPIFRYIYDKFQAINDTILAYFKDKPIVIGDKTYAPIDPKTGKKRKDRQKLAWIYQAMESQAMLMFNDLAQQWAGQEAILTTHDCLYFSLRLSGEQVKDITTGLQQHFPHLRFEHEAIYPITTDEHFNARFAQVDKELRQHRLRIEEETALGACYAKHKEIAKSFGCGLSH